MDSATAKDIEGLPGIGPALAKRIVANRADDGAFGCLAALRAVKGIGPTLLRRFDSLVVFGGAPRATCR
jgi:competence protein ComEA